jgi:hypothetical protein
MIPCAAHVIVKCMSDLGEADPVHGGAIPDKLGSYQLIGALIR